MSDYSDVTDLFCLRDYGETLVTIKRDGTIEYGDKYTPDDAAKVFWSKIQHHDRIAKLLSEIDFVRAENEKLREALNGVLKAFENVTMDENSKQIFALRAAAAAIRESGDE